MPTPMRHDPTRDALTGSTPPQPDSPQTAGFFFHADRTAPEHHPSGQPRLIRPHSPLCHRDLQPQGTRQSSGGTQKQIGADSKRRPSSTPLVEIRLANHPQPFDIGAPAMFLASAASTAGLQARRPIET
jgi:hypothetical protein